MTLKKNKETFHYKIFEFLLKYKALFALTFLALATRLYGIVDKDLWFDEVLDIDQAIKPVRQIISEVTITPLHYLVVHVFSLISTDIVFLRLPSILFGLASVLLLYLTVKKTGSTKVAFVSALLLAISPMSIEFSQQILHYSYFVFFTITTLYFYIDLFIKPRFELQTVLLFVLFTICNLTTHLSASIVIILQLIFFFAYYMLQPKLFMFKFIKLFKNRNNKFFLFAIIVTSVLLLKKFDYSAVASLYSRFNSNTPIPLGYSLVSQLKTEVLRDFNLPFFEAMFSWFGVGGGSHLVLYGVLFLIGLICLFKRNKSIFFFALTWISGPFIILHFLRMSHWFEEKYFIFIVPVYLYVIAMGITELVFVGAHTKRQIETRNPLLFLSCVLLIILSLNPIKLRTTYGFKVAGDQQFSWKLAIDHIKTKMKVGDKLFAIDDKFLKVYLGNKTRNSVWYSEEDLIHYTPEQYNELINTKNDNYYLSIPDIYDMRVGKLITAETLGIAGGFNTYKVRFIKNSPVPFDGIYTESFMKMDYLKDAYDWNNVYLTYKTDNNENLPQTELSNTIFLAPKNDNNAYISYKFRLNRAFPQLLLKVADLNTSKNTINIETRTEGGSFKQHSPISEIKYGTYRERIFDLAQATSNSELELIFRFKYNQPAPYTKLVSGLKSFTLAPSIFSEPQLEPNTQNEYTYDAELETKKNPKWATETLENFGWIQTRFGILYRLSGEKKDGLVYKFTIPPNTSTANLTTKTFTKDQTLSVSFSNDNYTFSVLDNNTNELREIEHAYSIDSNFITNKDSLYIKIQTEKPNQFGALRNLKIYFK